MEKYLVRKTNYILFTLIILSLSLSQATNSRDLLRCKSQLLENLRMALSNEELIDIRRPLPQEWLQLGTDQDQIFSEYYNGRFRIYIQEDGSTYVSQVPSSRATNDGACKVFGESINEDSLTYSNDMVFYDTSLSGEIIEVPNSSAQYSMTKNILCSTREESFRNRAYVPKMGGYKESNLSWTSEVSSQFTKVASPREEGRGRRNVKVDAIGSEEFGEALNIRLLDLVSVNNYNSEDEIEDSIFRINKPLSQLSREDIDRIQRVIESGLNTARGEGTSCSRLQFSSEIQGSYFSATGYQRLMDEFSNRAQQRERDLRRLEISGQCATLDRLTGMCQHINPPIVR